MQWKVKASHKIDMYNRHYILPWQNPNTRENPRNLSYEDSFNIRTSTTLPRTSSNPNAKGIYRERDPKVLIFFV